MPVGLFERFRGPHDFILHTLAGKLARSGSPIAKFSVVFPIVLDPMVNAETDLLPFVHDFPRRIPLTPILMLRPHLHKSTIPDYNKPRKLAKQ